MCETISKHASWCDLNNVSIEKSSLLPKESKEDIHVMKNLTLQEVFKNCVAREAKYKDWLSGCRNLSLRMDLILLLASLLLGNGGV